jgi:SAM-dependent methyltransferase
MDDSIRANQAIWNAWSAVEDETDHAKDAAKVRAGGCSLRPIELVELGGEVAGKTLLHLLCNRGADTLSWARLGARVTGMDFSSTAIERAWMLAKTTGIDARFIQAELSRLPEVLYERFDIVYASYGVLCWMHDLARWAEVAAHFVTPGGILYLVEMHPFTAFLERASTTALPASTLVGERSQIPSSCDWEGAEGEVTLGLRLGLAGAYFHRQEPAREEVDILASDGTASAATLHTWSYSLGEVVSALANARLRIEFLHEHRATFYQQYAALVPTGDGLWRWPDPAISFPLLFSLRARG